jgi:hypothetical protein
VQRSPKQAWKPEQYGSRWGDCDAHALINYAGTALSSYAGTALGSYAGTALGSYAGNALGSYAGTALIT